MAPKHLTARYAGHCQACETAIHPGQKIVWFGRGRAQHESCSDAIIAAADREAARREYEPDPTDLAYEDACARACGF